MQNNPTHTIHSLYPNLNEKELAKAEENLERYLALVLRMFERMEIEGFAQGSELTANNGTLGCTPSHGATSEHIA
jgi:hypothetical protein